MKNRICYFLCMVTAFVVGIDSCLFAKIYHSREIAKPKFELLVTEGDQFQRSEVYRASNGTTVYYSVTRIHLPQIDMGRISLNPSTSLIITIYELQKSGGKLLDKKTVKDFFGNETIVWVLMECPKPNGTFIKMMRSDGGSFQIIDSDSRESALAFERTLRD